MSVTNIKDLQPYNVSLIADSDVAFVVVKNADGEVLEQYGDVAEDLSLQRTVSINYSRDEATGKVLKLLAEEFKNHLEFVFEWQGRRFKPGVSIGVVAITQHADSIESLMEQADTCCYIAKQKGRNQMHLHSVS